MKPKTAAAILKAAKLDKTFWGQRIIAAEVRGYFTYGDNSNANWWPTCACGKQDAEISRSPDGCPVDDNLKWLGIKFGNLVLLDKHTEAAKFSEAASVLVSIEKRAAIVLAQELKRRKKVKATR